MARPRSPRPTLAQLDMIRADLHQSVDRVCAAIPRMQQLVRDMARGYPPGCGDSVARGRRLTDDGHSDPLGELVAGDQFDPTAAYRTWMRRWWDLTVAVYLLDSEQSELLSVKGRQPRQNGVDVCAECGTPNPRMRRIDNEPFCATTCYRDRVAQIQDRTA